MPRHARIQYAGAVYHVMCRGDRREPIFRDDYDRRTFLSTLADVCQRTGFVMHAYVLMPNHYHWLLETPEPNLVDGMKWFQGTYTQRFNARHQLVGHLFQGRYKAIPVDPHDPAFFRRVGDYIHLNPARARLLQSVANKLEAYPWSSYPAFVAATTLPVWLHRKRLFSAHGLADDDARARMNFAETMQQRVMEVLDSAGVEALEEEWRTLRRGWFVGSEDFRVDMMERIASAVRGRKRSSYCREGLRMHDEKEAARQLAQACSTLEVSLPELWQRRQTDPVKQAIAWHVKSHCVIEDQWICEKLEMRSRSNVCRAVQRFREARDAETRDLRTKLRICAD